MDPDLPLWLAVAASVPWHQNRLQWRISALRKSTIVKEHTEPDCCSCHEHDTSSCISAVSHSAPEGQAQNKKRGKLTRIRFCQIPTM